MKPEQRSIQSIEVGFRLIRVLEEAEAKLPLKTLSSRAGMTAGKAHQYLVSFMRLGLIVQDHSTGHYGLGPYALQLGLAALRQVNPSEIAGEVLERLQARFELPTYFSIWGQMGPFIALKRDFELPTPFGIKPGFVFPLLATATGNIFLAYMPEQATRPLIEKEGRLHPDLLARAEDMRREIRAAGYTVSKGHLFRGFAGVSCPVFDHEGALAGAVTILGVASFIDPGPFSDIVMAVKKAAAEISHKLGFKA